jgi:arylsulfatase A
MQSLSAKRYSCGDREGDWKLIEFFGDHVDASHRFSPGAHTELYNLREDVGETLNVAAEHPDLRERLRKQFYHWIDTVGAPVPDRNPHSDRSRWSVETREK